jgi:chromosome segregation ATPase
MSSLRDKMMAGIRSRSESPHPTTTRGRQLEEGEGDQPTSSSKSTSKSTTTRTASMPRMPSKDALSRSSHNAIPRDDGSVQSKDNIIANLKKSNNKLASRTAEMEATFINQYETLATEIVSQKHGIEDKSKENLALKEKVMSHESKLKEGIQIITALEQEKQFQKQTIIDLKNQLFQLQNELEDSQFEKSEEITLQKKRTEESEKRVQQLETERNNLRQKADNACKERDTAKAELYQLQQQSRNGDNNTSIDAVIQDPQQVTTVTAVSSPASASSDTTSEVRQTWRQLEEKKEQLDASLTLLHETQSQLATLDHKHKAIQKQFDEKLEAQTNSIKIELHKETDELKSSLRSRDETIANLHERLENYNDELTKAEDEVDRLNKEVDGGRLHELREELEETTRLLENERHLNSELIDKYDGLTSTVDQLEKETEELRINSVDEIIEEKEIHIKDLEHEVSVFRRKLEEENQQKDMLLNIKVARIKELEDKVKQAATTPDMKVKQLEHDKKELEKELESMENELHNVIEAQNEMEVDMRRKLQEKEQGMGQQTISEDCGDFVNRFDMSTNSIGLVNDTVVTRLKSNMTDLEEDFAVERTQFEKQLEEKHSKIVSLQTEIVTQTDNIDSLKVSYDKKMKILLSDIEEQKTSTKKLTSQLKTKNDDIVSLKEEINKLQASVAQRDIESREDIEASNENWMEEKRELLETQRNLEKALDNSLKDNNAQGDRIQALEKHKDSLMGEKKLLQRERNEYVRKLESMKKTVAENENQAKLSETLMDCDLLKDKINDLENKNFSQERELQNLRKDKSLLEELKHKGVTHQNELDDMKTQMELEIREHKRLLASFKNDGRKRSDKLKLIELNAEVDKLRVEVRKLKLTSNVDSEKKMQATMEKAYTSTNEITSEKEFARHDEKLINKIEELNKKLSDRETTIVATLRSSVLQDQKITALKAQMKSLRENIDRETNSGKSVGREPSDNPDDMLNTSPGRHGAFEELQNLRESVHNHEETHISLLKQLASLKKQLADARTKSRSSIDSGSESKLEKQIEGYKTKVRERDGAIQRLVKSSITQEQQVASLRDEIRALKRSKFEPEGDYQSVASWEEMERVQKESEIFAGQIIEQDEEIEDLRTFLHEAEVKAEQNANLQMTIDNLQEQLGMREGESQIKLRTFLHEAEVKAEQNANLQMMIDDLQEQLEMREGESQIKLEYETEKRKWDEEIIKYNIYSEAIKMELGEEKKKREILEFEHDMERRKWNEEMIKYNAYSEAIKNMELEEEKKKRENLTMERRKWDEEMITYHAYSEAIKNMELEEEKKKRENLEVKVEEIQVENSKPDKRGLRIERIQKELEEVEETNEKLQYEIRDLRRKLRSAEFEVERVNDLEKELNETKRSLMDLKQGNHLSFGGNNHQLKAELKHAIEKRDDMESESRKLREQYENSREKNRDLEGLYKDTLEKCRDIESSLAVCKEEKVELRDKLTTKVFEMKQTEAALREELGRVIKALEEKCKALEDNESAMKGQLASQKTLREMAINEKENAIARAMMLQRDFDGQNDVVVSLSEEVKLLRNTQMQRADTESTEIIAALSLEVKKLRKENMSKEVDEQSAEIITELSKEVKKLRNNQSENDSDHIILALSEEVKTLHAALKNASQGQPDVAEIENVIRSEIDQELQSIKKQKDFLGKENARLQANLENIGDGEHMDELKKQVEEAEIARTLFEKTMISTYERKLNLMQMNKDLTIDGLRKDLTQSKENLKETESDLLDKIRSLDVERNQLDSELKAKMNLKNKKIAFLEQQLSGHVQLLSHMQEEMDQLQGAMETNSVSRRADVEELEEELISFQNKCTRYEREIADLKMMIDDLKAHHKNELGRLQYNMEEIRLDNDETPVLRQLAEKDRMAVNEMARQVERLKEKVRCLQEENFEFREKIERGDKRSSKNDKWRNSALQEQVQALTKRIREMEGEEETSIMSSSSRRSRPNVPPVPRGGTTYRRSGGSAVDDISTHTEGTL